jgi:hypothetical protein
MASFGTSYGYVNALAVLPGGDLVAAGRFDGAGGVPANNIARWNGSAWSNLGPGLLGGSGTYPALALAVSPSGDLLAGGEFTSAGGAPAPSIARWNGSAWSALGSGTNGTTNAIAILPSGEVVAGGDFTLAGGKVSAFLARWSDTGKPAVARQPAPRTVTPGQTMTLTGAPATGYTGVSFQWRRNNANIGSGPGGASPGGGSVSGASGTLASPTDGGWAILTINNIQPSDAGAYSVVFSNACGSASSQAAAVTVANPCYANCDQSTSSPILNINDFQCFLNAFAAGTGYANCDASTIPPVLNVNDFQCFVNAFAAGCP